LHIDGKKWNTESDIQNIVCKSIITNMAMVYLNDNNDDDSVKLFIYLYSELNSQWPITDDNNTKTIIAVNRSAELEIYARGK
jgi:hypothetical protein